MNPEETVNKDANWVPGPVTGFCNKGNGLSGNFMS